MLQFKNNYLEYSVPRFLLPNVSKLQIYYCNFSRAYFYCFLLPHERHSTVEWWKIKTYYQTAGIIVLLPWNVLRNRNFHSYRVYRCAQCTLENIRSLITSVWSASKLITSHTCPAAAPRNMYVESAVLYLPIAFIVYDVYVSLSLRVFLFPLLHTQDA